MRDFLTGLAIILIVVLTTVLVAPYFVDWTSQRGFLEARLTHALGQKVTIGGAIDLKLLPTPYLVLDQVVVGGDDAPVRIGIHHLDLELTVAPLLHGEFDIVEARLVEPTIRVNLEHDRTLPVLPSAPAFQADVRFDRIQVSDGTLAIADPMSGRTFVFDHLDLDADAGSFAGPFKVHGAEGADDKRTKFHLATGAPDGGHAHARLVVEETPAHAALELDGTVDVAAAGADTVRQSFDGSLVVSGHLWQAADDPIAWKLSGPLKADSRQAVLDGGEFRLGSEDAGLTLQAKATAQLDATPTLALDLRAKQLDFDRLSGAPVDAVKPPPPKLPDLATMRQILAAAQPPIQTGVDVAVDNATYGGETLSDMQAHLSLGADERQPLKLSGDGPGGAHVAIDGQLATRSNPTFVGSLDLEADNLPRAVDWLASIAPDVSWKGGDMPFKTIKIAGHVTAGPDTFAGNKLAVTLDRSILAGAARFVRGDASRPAKLTLDLEAQALDLDGLPSFEIVRGANPFDLDLRLDAKAIRVARVGDGALDTGHIRLALAKAGRHVALQEFRADDLGGATIRATGNLDPERSALAITLDAARLDAVAALARQLAPGPIADALVSRAAVLAPAKLKIEAALDAQPNGTLAPTRLSVVGTLGDTRVDAAAQPDAGQTSVSASLASADGSTILRQLGVPALPMAVIGASRVTLSARGHAGDPLDSTVAVTLGATKLDVTGRFDILSPVPTGSGTLRLRSPDLTPLMQSLALAFPDMTGSVAADLAGALALDADGTTLSDLKGSAGGIGTSGTLRYRRGTGDQPALTGALVFDRLALASVVGLALGPSQPAGPDAPWSRQPLAVGLIDPPPAAVTLKAKTLELVPGIDATDASLDLGIASNLVTLGNVIGTVSGGRVEASATLRRDSRQATVEGKLALDHVGVRLATLDTSVTGTLDFAGGGGSSLAIMASLAGSGEATTADLRIPRGDPTALPKIFQDVENDALTVDQDAVVRAFDDAARAPLVAGTRHFTLSLAAGTLHVDPVASAPAGGGPVSTKIDAAFDLTQARIEQHLDETLEALPKNWTGAPPKIGITLSGALRHPSRTVDVSGFLNAVAARALARETARIEAYEFDIRERAFFNARLQSERRREAERQKVEDDARKAEAERQSRLIAAQKEAARQERVRKEQTAKAAQQKAAQAEAERAARDRERREPSSSRDAQPPPDTPQAPPPTPPEDTQPPPAGTDPSALGRY